MPKKAAAAGRWPQQFQYDSDLAGSARYKAHLRGSSPVNYLELRK
jgi:hypothetical protein